MGIDLLKRYSEIFIGGLLLADLLLVVASWLAAYALRFHAGLEAPAGVPPFRYYLALTGLVAPLWLLSFRYHGLYQPRRTGSLFSETQAIFGASVVGLAALIGISFFLRSYPLSRGVVLIFFATSAASVAAFRFTARSALRRLRKRGLNLRYALVVGGGDLAEQVIDRIHAHPELGLRVVGALSEDTSQGRVAGVPVLGRYTSIREVLERRSVDQVFLALPRQESDLLEKVLRDLEEETVSVRVVPDLRSIMTLRSSVEELDGLPMISLRESPFVGWAAVQKRCFDCCVSLLLLALSAPLLGAIALAIRLGNGRPVFYRQQRMGLDGRVFSMLKFRTMPVDAERSDGPVWTEAGDSRPTRLGRLLRRTSLDELPQLWNVLRGDMSLVGPRPERPVFIDKFRHEIPGYMLRLKVKAGLTGWAQVHGWRGNTSLHERIEHDIYYIQHWSFGLDLWILALTLWRGGRKHNAY